jgi:HAD superfamily hydrolase (TIGR01509 family)
VAIEALLFDLGKVLIDFDFELCIRRFTPRSTLSREQLEGVMRHSAWITRYETGQISTADFHRYLSEHGKLQMSIEEFHEAWAAVFLPGLLVPERLLANLKARYPLILISNTNEAHARFIKGQYPVFSYFEQRIFSHEVGSLKPDRKIFEAAIAAAGKPPSSLFFTDDRVENIEAAQELGIWAHRFVSVPDLLNALKKHGVNVGDFVPA